MPSTCYTLLPFQVLTTRGAGKGILSPQPSKEVGSVADPSYRGKTGASERANQLPEVREEELGFEARSAELLSPTHRSRVQYQALGSQNPHDSLKVGFGGR